MASSFFRDLLDQIVERGRVLRAFSLGEEDHGGTIETLSRGLHRSLKAPKGLR